VSSESTKKCALLLDFENIILGLENDVLAGDHGFSIEEIVRYAEDEYGPVVYRKAFADWGNPKFRAYAVELQRAGVEMQHVVRTGMNSKNAADMFLTIHALDSLRAFPDVEVFILGTGDGDFLPLLTRLRAAGRRVVVIGTRGTTAETLLQNSDDFVCYVQGGLYRVPRLHGPLSELRRTVSDILSEHDGIIPVNRMVGMLRQKNPKLLPDGISVDEAGRFIEAVVPDAIVRQRGRTRVIEHVSSVQAASNLLELSFEEYMQQTRGFLSDATRREELLGDLFGILKTRGEDGLTLGELRSLVDPEEEITDKEWFGTIFSLTCGGCVWEDPATSTLPSAARQVQIYRGVETFEEFRSRYYTSLLYRAYSERPDINAEICSKLLFPDDPDSYVSFFEEILERLSERKNAGSPAS